MTLARELRPYAKSWLVEGLRKSIYASINKRRIGNISNVFVNPIIQKAESESRGGIVGRSEFLHNMRVPRSSVQRSLRFPTIQGRRTRRCALPPRRSWDRTVDASLWGEHW